MKRIFILTDSHFGHSKLSKYWKYRPEGFEDKILDNLDRMVGKDDLLIHLGDICIGDDED